MPNDGDGDDREVPPWQQGDLEVPDPRSMLGGDGGEGDLDFESLVRRLPLGALVIWVIPEDTKKREVAVLMKMPIRKANWRGVPVGVGHIELHTPIPFGPVVRFLFQVLDRPDAPLTLDAFLNPADPDGREMLGSLRKQQRLLLYAYGEHSQKIGLKQVKWPERQRQACMKIMVQTEGVPVIWPDALNAVKAENPL